MIIILRPNTSEIQISNLVEMLRSYGVTVAGINGKHKNILGLVGEIGRASCRERV